MKRFYIFKALALLGIMFMGIQSKAQLINCNVFLQAAHVEVGINWNGAYGSSANAPAGYHPNGSVTVENSAACGYTWGTAGHGIGFVADPAIDGWAVGTPAFFGDYFMPGVPQEGWSFMVNGKQVNAWNGSDIDSPATYTVFTYSTLAEDTSILVTTYWYDSATMVMDTLVNFGYDTTWHHDTTYNMHGGNIAYDTVGSTLVGTWQGMFDSVAITQITTINMDSLYFNIEVVMTNLSTSPKDNVYYLRTVDPDNDQPQSGTFQTFNKIEYQLPNAEGLTVVSARGTVYSDAYLALGTGDPRAKCFINRTGLMPNFGTLATMYAVDTANYLYNLGDTLNADVAINLAFKIGHLASVDTVGASDSALRTTSSYIPPNRAIINYAYNFNGAYIAAGALHNNNIVSSSNVMVYPNPVKNTINVTGLNKNEQVNIYNMMGVKVLSFTANGNSVNTFNINDLAFGHYLLQVIDINGNVKTRTPIQKL